MSPGTEGAGQGAATVAAGKRGKLERTLGLREALTIGIGTMVGAGIFVFPGLAVEDAGPAAALSFALGAGIALLVALPTSELATAMPRSGGGYYFVSRALGGAAGSLVGLGQWLGLVFASAFYLAGFGHYLVNVLGQVGMEAGPSPEIVGFGTALALTGVAVLGTRRSGRLQYVVVMVLVVILTVVLGWGLARATGLLGPPAEPGPFAPRGTLPIFTTAALVFTSYLGFAQIANVAGEVRRPSRNLPLAMTGSVILVGLLYVLTILVSTSVLGTGTMAAAGETAMTELGRALLGTAGGLVIGVAGLLATLSSANASILSSSRAAFALSRDGLVPEGASRVSRRFRTPHVALLLTGVPVAFLVLLGRIEVLAEAASILHLLMYGLICISQIALRRSGSLWYRPSFLAPGSFWLPGLGAVLCFALVGFMSPGALVWSGAVLLAAGGWYLVYGRGVELRGVEELAPAPGVTPAKLLLEVEVPDSPGIPDDLIRALSPDQVILLGWTRVPEQSTPEQVQDELGDDAEADLERVADRLRTLGMEVETELVFTGDLVQTVDRMARERESDVVLPLQPMDGLRRVLVALPDPELAHEAAGYAARIARASGARVELLPLAPAPRQEEAADGEQPEDGKMEELARRLRQVFLATGILEERLRVRSGTEEAGSPASRILDAAEDADLVILGEEAPKKEARTFGDLNQEVTRKARVPVLIVRRGARA